MRIEWEHKFGVMEQHDIQYYVASLHDVQPSEYDSVLTQGWLMQHQNNTLQWYQSRSTRSNLKKTDYTMFGNKYYKIGDWTKRKAEIRHIYSAYCHYKNYKDLYSDEVYNWLPEDILFEYYDGGEMVAWSKLRHYSDNSVETVFFAWDYNKPQLHLGNNSLYHELAWAKQQGYKHVYMGPGYELGCLYKAKVQGFEWWTGKEWSVDNQSYKRIVRRDSKVKNLEDIGKL